MNSDSERLKEMLDADGLDGLMDRRSAGLGLVLASLSAASAAAALLGGLWVAFADPGAAPGVLVFLVAFLAPWVVVEACLSAWRGVCGLRPWSSAFAGACVLQLAGLVIAAQAVVAGESAAGFLIAAFALAWSAHAHPVARRAALDAAFAAFCEARATRLLRGVRADACRRSWFSHN